MITNRKITKTLKNKMHISKTKIFLIMKMIIAEILIWIYLNKSNKKIKITQIINFNKKLQKMINISHLLIKVHIQNNKKVNKFNFSSNNNNNNKLFKKKFNNSLVKKDLKINLTILFQMIVNLVLKIQKVMKIMTLKTKV